MPHGFPPVHAAEPARLVNRPGFGGGCHPYLSPGFAPGGSFDSIAAPSSCTDLPRSLLRPGSCARAEILRQDTLSRASDASPRRGSVELPSFHAVLPRTLVRDAGWRCDDASAARRGGTTCP